MRYAVVNTEKEMRINAVLKNFVFLGIVYRVRKSSVYHGLRTHEIKMSIDNREGEQLLCGYFSLKYVRKVIGKCFKKN